MRGQPGAHETGSGLVFGSVSCVAHDLFKSGEVFEIAFAARGRNAADGERAIAFVALGDFDHAGMFEHAEMAAEVAVSERAELFEVAERHAARVGEKRSEQAETGTLVDDAVEALVREAAFAARVFRVDLAFIAFS